VKKIISIGVALALLTMAVVPGAVAAQCEYEGIAPSTYAKIPFTIIGTGFYLMEEVLTALVDGELLPESIDWLPSLMQPMGDWAMGPLAWTVDMLAWGVGLAGTVVGSLSGVMEDLGMDLGMDLTSVGDLMNDVACALFTPFSCNITGAAWNPCE